MTGAGFGDGEDVYLVSREWFPRWWRREFLEADDAEVLGGGAHLDAALCCGEGLLGLVR